MVSGESAMLGRCQRSLTLAHVDMSYQVNTGIWVLQQLEVKQYSDIGKCFFSSFGSIFSLFKSSSDQ